jgi:nucleotide-binding universal stress UspA family protein
MKTILASLTGLGGDRSVLDCAIALAGKFEAQIECLHVRLDEATALALGQYGMVDTIEREQGERSRSARLAFEEAGRRHAITVTGAADDRLSWHQIEGYDLADTPRRARLADLVVAARDSSHGPGRLAEIVMKSGRPVLVAPPKFTGAIGEAVAVAWKDGPESARALTVAMPLLTKAQRVLLVFVREDPEHDGPELRRLDELKARLGRHGIRAETLAVATSAAGATETLRETVYDANCDLLVTGAYGHSRLREYVFGGVTREILGECALPVLMFH